MTQPARDPRNGLRMSATLATVFTIVGHLALGFEQSVASVFVSVGTAHATALFFEWVDARANGRPAGFAGGGWRRVVDFLLSAHMTGITMSFLIYTNVHLWVLAFMVAVAIGSKFFFRVQIGGRMRHFMNPSNFGVAVGLLLFQWTGMIPWGFTINLHGIWDWALPALILVLGTRLNLLFTGKLPLIGAWLVGFVVQAVVRSSLLGNPLLAELALLTNVPMVIFTLYMITDPQTSPAPIRGQVAFGLALAAAYGILMALRINYALFYAVTAVAAVRGSWMVAVSLSERRSVAAVPAMASK